MSQLKNYVVFGGTGGIGEAVVARLLSQGHRVTSAARNEAKLLEQSAKFPGLHTMVCDCTDVTSVERVFGAVGEFDGVCVAVGSLLLKPAHLTSDAEWAHTLAQNLTAAFYVLRAGVKAAGVRPVSFVFFSSVAARLGLPNHEAIAAAKAGIEGLVRSAAASYCSRGVRVNAVAPGLVATPLTTRITTNEVSRAASEAMHPLGRIGTPQDIAAVSVWLLSEESSWVTGQVISVDGGMSTVKPPARKV